MDIKWTLTEKTNKQLISSQHAFTKSCLNNLINFYDKMTVFVDQGTAVNIVHLDLGKAFDGLWSDLQDSQREAAKVQAM